MPLNPAGRRSLLAVCLLVSGTVHAHDCDVGGVAVNPDNGATLAGKTGILTCRAPDGSIRHEQELRDGEYVGLDRMVHDDGSVSERQVNANRNSHGPARELYPDGSIKRTATYDDGDLVGESRSYHRGGQLASVGFHVPGDRSGGVSIEFNTDGSLRALRCGARSLVAEDRSLCGFGGSPIRVGLYDAQGRPSARLTLKDGQPIAGEEIDRSGAVATSFETTPQGRVERRFHAGGQRASETRIVDGYRVEQSEWYMNGQLKLRETNEPVDRAARSVQERYRDTGVLEVREHRVGRRLQRAERYNEAGTLTEESFFDDESRLSSRRRFGADGSLIADESFHPDGSVKSTSSTAQIAH